MPEFAGAWNAVAYRFQALVEAGDQFAISLTGDGPHPPPEPRYHQEKSLIEFFAAGFDTFESAFYGLFAIGTMVTGLRRRHSD